MYDTLLFAIGDLIPISFQLSSLIFGYIRRKKDIKSRLIVGRGESEITADNRNTDCHSLKNSIISSAISIMNDQYFDPPLMVYIDQSAYNAVNKDEF